MTKRTRAVIGDPLQHQLHKVDVEIARLEKAVGEKVAAVDADRKRHPLDQDIDLQQRLAAEVRVLRGRVAGLQQERFGVELGDLAKPKGKPPASVAAPVKHRAWEIEEDALKAGEVSYPEIMRSVDQEAFTKGYQQTVSYWVAKIQDDFRRDGFHADQRVEMDFAVMLMGAQRAAFVWATQRSVALEKRVAELEARPTVTPGDKAQPITRAVTKVTKFDGQGRIAEFEKLEGEAEQIDLLARVEALEARPQLEYRGTWKPDQQYKQGALTTHDGSMWHAEIGSKGVTPGQGEGCWRLCVKKGRDARS